MKFRLFKKESGLCFLSALLLTMSFPRLEIWMLAWVAMIPFLVALEGKSPREGFKIGFWCGFLSFFGTLYWLFHITTWFSVIAAVGVIALFLYLSIYYALFGLFYCYTRTLSPVQRLILLPSGWCALEWVRAHLFSGFDWISLGHSQFRNLMSIQIADITGVFGVSFVVMMTNFFLKEIRHVRRSKQSLFLFRGIFYVIFIGHLLYGFIRLNEPVSEKTYKVGVVQGNIEQEMKWAEFAWPVILKAHRNLTLKAAALNPELIIWPESSFPGIMGEDDALFAEIQSLVKGSGIPLLIGSIEKRKEKFYNTALYLDEQAVIVQQYDKIHLVPFGEFLPGRSFLGKAAELVPISDFTPGSEYTIFNHQAIKPFSLLICFEDTVAYLARRFVQNGSQLLVNITNDAWFKDSKASTLHVSSSIFRTIENRRSMIRSANTGLSNAIDPYGRIVHEVIDKDGKKANIPGFMVVDIPLSSRITFYTKFGDIFAFLCFGCILGGLFLKRKV